MSWTWGMRLRWRLKRLLTDIVHVILGMITGYCMLNGMEAYGFGLMVLFIVYQILESASIRDQPHLDIAEYTVGYLLVWGFYFVTT